MLQNISEREISSYLSTLRPGDLGFGISADFHAEFQLFAIVNCEVVELASEFWWPHWIIGRICSGRKIKSHESLNFQQFLSSNHFFFFSSELQKGVKTEFGRSYEWVLWWCFSNVTGFQSRPISFRIFWRFACRTRTWKTKSYLVRYSDNSDSRGLMRSKKW